MLEPGALEVLSWIPGGAEPQFMPVMCVTRRDYDGEIVEAAHEDGPPDPLHARPPVDRPRRQRWRRARAQAGGRAVRRPTGCRSRIGSARAPPTARRWRRCSAPSRPRSCIRARSSCGSAPSVPPRSRARPMARAARDLRGQRRGAVGRGQADRNRAARRGRARRPRSSRHELRHREERRRTRRRRSRSTTSFWRVAGLYLAEGCTIVRRPQQRAHRLVLSSREGAAPRRRGRRVLAAPRYRARARARRRPHTSYACSRAWSAPGGRRCSAWAATCYEQRLPDLVWDRPAEDKWALLSGLWEGDGSWSLVNGGPSVILEMGTVSEELADGVQRLLGELGIVASQRIGRVREVDEGHVLAARQRRRADRARDGARARARSPRRRGVDRAAAQADRADRPSPASTTTAPRGFASSSRRATAVLRTGLLAWRFRASTHS